MRIVVPTDLSLPKIPEAAYKVRVTGHKVKVGKDSGNTYVQLEETIQTPSPDPNIKTVGRKIFDNFTLTAESLWKMDSLTRAAANMPLPAGDYSEEELIAKFMSIVTNKEVVIIVKHGSQGREEVKEYKPATA